VAKSKPNRSAKPKANGARGASISRDGIASASIQKTRVAAQPAFSPLDIGNVAGEVWGLLCNNGEQTLAAVKKSVDAPPELVLAAIGWLAREDKLEFTTTGRTVKISLR
jgi:hypothetical protein